MYLRMLLLALVSGLVLALPDPVAPKVKLGGAEIAVVKVRGGEERVEVVETKSKYGATTKTNVVSVGELLVDAYLGAKEGPSAISTKFFKVTPNSTDRDIVAHCGGATKVEIDPIRYEMESDTIAVSKTLSKKTWKRGAQKKTRWTLTAPGPAKRATALAAKTAKFDLTLELRRSDQSSAGVSIVLRDCVVERAVSGASLAVTFVCDQVEFAGLPTPLAASVGGGQAPLHVTNVDGVMSTYGDSLLSSITLPTLASSMESSASSMVSTSTGDSSGAVTSSMTVSLGYYAW